MKANIVWRRDLLDFIGHGQIARFNLATENPDVPRILVGHDHCATAGCYRKVARKLATRRHQARTLEATIVSNLEDG